ncbi:MAG TPA: phospholipase D-like domain-containing protein [Streptosporangiaceae bacterium]|jgi:phosphatidylserine/phosphatidylglycerophosphate/cardiolipin synthase-like enzyme|nr:phospholipase D-like domain-containing protein [Streptosporangiaceae bacterium]
MSVTPGRLLTILIGVAMLAVAGCTSTLSIGTASKHHLSKQHSKQHHKKSHRSQHAHGHPKHHSHAHSRHHAKHHSHKSGHAAPAQDTLVVEPNAGFGTVYSLINHARHSIDVTMYEFADTTAEHDLAAAAKRGVQVRVILDQKETSVDTPAYDYFKSHGIKVVWSWSKYTYTHQKTLTFDNSVSVVQTANLTANYYKTSRDFLVVDRNAADVAAIIRVFNADFVHKAITPGDGHDLVWSPTDSQRQILGLINSAKKSLRIYSEEMGDTTVIDALIAAAKRGVDVSVCGENLDGEYTSTFEKMARAGVHIAYYSSSTGFYIHGKVIEADYRNKDARVFIGSENFSSTSLNENRELGLIISTPSVLSGIARVFATDFAKGTHTH